MPNDNLRFINALNCQNFSRPPVWFMRQAGRHLEAYRKLREKYSFIELYHNPDLIAEVTLLPMHTYELDAAILFSDILIIPEALGLGLRFEEKIGPIFSKPIQSVQDIYDLKEPDVTHFNFVQQGIYNLLPQLQKPLIGFCGAPFTVASYMIEGKSSRDFKKTKKWLYNDPKSFHLLLKKIADWSIAYLRLQIDAGVQAIQIFDSWANCLADPQFKEFSFAYLQYILEGLDRPNIPTIVFCRGSSVFASQLTQLKTYAIGLDWNCRMKDVRHCIGTKIALQGNLDPDLLYAPLPKIRSEVNHLLDEMQDDPGFILNLGHGIAPDVSEAAVREVIACVLNR